MVSWERYVADEELANELACVEHLQRCGEAVETFADVEAYLGEAGCEMCPHSKDCPLGRGSDEKRIPTAFVPHDPRSYRSAPEAWARGEG